MWGGWTKLARSLLVASVLSCTHPIELGF